MTCDTSKFKQGIADLSTALNKENANFNDVNLILDNLNALNLQNSLFTEEGTERLLIECCTAIPSCNSLLVAKSCNLLLNQVLKNKGVLRTANLKLFLLWINEAFEKSSDVAFLDLLQVVNILIRNHQSVFKENGRSLVPFLFEKLESKASVLQPNDIKIWRMYCIKSLSKCIMTEDCTVEVNELCDVLYSQETDNLLVHAKIWRIVIESLDTLAPKGNSKWLKGKLNEIIGIVEVAATLGLNGRAPQPPKQIFPSSYFAPELSAVDLPSKSNFKDSSTSPTQHNIITKANQPSKKRQKPRAKKVNWVEHDVNDDSQDVKCMKGLEVYHVAYLTSDSDYSDTESGKLAYLAKEQAKTRHATFNLIIRLSNVLKGKQLYEYYNVLINALIQCVRNETTHKTKIAVLAAIGALLMHSKPFIAQAQHSDGTSFLAFSASLSELVSGLHSCLRGCLASAPPPSVVTPLLHTTATLISVSPYHRLKRTLLTNLFNAFHPYLKHKDPAVCVGSLKCLNEIASINPYTNEQKDILTEGMKYSVLSDSWVLSIITSFLKDGETNAAVRVASWQLVGCLCKHHFSLLEDNLPALEELLFLDLKSSNIETQLYATYALNKFLEAIIAIDELKYYNKELWTKLLNGPLISLLQSPEMIACEACDCLANMGPIMFSNLTDDKQILVVTLIFGCINHEKPTVRAAAVHTLGIFLLFPQMNNEQFLFDANDLLLKSLSDTFLVVRIKAAWALGNLVDLIFNNPDEESLHGINVKTILSASLNLTKDDDLVKANILRAIGLLLSALTDNDLLDCEVTTLLEKSVQFLLKCTSSGTKMKMRWNACHAVSTMVKNEALLPYSDKWMGGLVQTLCNLIVSCNNFKVRASACSALCQIPTRRLFGLLYSFVWTSLMDGLDNAVNMPDFREYKHQDSLKQQLCLGVCHMARLLAAEDLAELESVMDYRLENLREHLIDFQNNTLPEQTGTLIEASNNIQNLIQMPNTLNHRPFLLSLKNLFSVFHTR